MKKIASLMLAASISVLGLTGCSAGMMPTESPALKAHKMESTPEYEAEVEKYSKAVTNYAATKGYLDEMLAHQAKSEYQKGNLTEKFLLQYQEQLDKLVEMFTRTKEEEEEFIAVLKSGISYDKLEDADLITASNLVYYDEHGDLTAEFKETLESTYKKEYEQLKKEKLAYDKKHDEELQEEIKRKEEQPEEEPEEEQREDVIGTSNKKFSDIDDGKPTKVLLNDKTGNWRLFRVATMEDTLKYLADYYKTNFNSDKEVHAIVNFTLDTTTRVGVFSNGILSVTVHEYVDREEHDANQLFSGKVLGDYLIYLDNGDIVKLS